jgi:hypothetical protein
MSLPPPPPVSRNVVDIHLRVVVDSDPQGADAGIFSNEEVEGVPGGKPLET